MSGAQQTNIDVQDAPPPQLDPDVERVARINGWKPKEEFAGDKARWIPADLFLARGVEDPSILAARNRTLVSRFDDLQRTSAADRRALETKLDGAMETVSTITTMMRSSEQRAYDRARRELKAEQAAAVTSGDTATFQRVDQQLEELEKTKPVEPPPVRTTPAPPTPAPLDPAVTRFFAENPWYTSTRPEYDPDMMAYADLIYNGLKAPATAHLSEEQRLERVTSEVKNRFPAKFQPRPPANGHDTAAPDRSEEPPSVASSTGAPPPRRTTNRFTFDAMPKESKDAYVRYAKMLEGKGAPLTKDEWATNYWGQFRDDGNP